jgi:hypothetical protein
MLHEPGLDARPGALVGRDELVHLPARVETGEQPLVLLSRPRLASVAR